MINTLCNWTVALVKLRIARATNQLNQIVEMYRTGLGLDIIGSFENHAGFDGIMLGGHQSDYHFEFTQEHGVTAPASHSSESLLVFYYPESSAWELAMNRMLQSGFKAVASHNPYWDQHGKTFEDIEGYRIVICHRDWPNA